MKLTDIPYFKTVIIMCTICDVCGIKSSEVKPGTAIEEKAIKFILKITDPSDLNRDLIKSEFATLEIPEVEFYMSSGTLGGKFTTIEGLLKDCREQLGDICPFVAGGDSVGESPHFWRVQAPKVIFFSSVIDKKEHTSFSLSVFRMFLNIRFPPYTNVIKTNMS